MIQAACVLVVAGLLSACGGSTTSEDSSSPPATPSDVSTTKAGAEEMVSDPPGDALLSSAPGYVDALSAGVMKEQETFSFRFTLAEPIPKAYQPPEKWDGLLWSFCVDTDGTADPSGYPFEASTPAPCEFIVTGLSEGEEVTGTLIDRRPLLDSKDAATTSIPVTLDGTTGTIEVQAAKLGDPKKFTWVMATSALALPWPNDKFVDIDEVPDSSFGDPAPWPARS